MSTFELNEYGYWRRSETDNSDLPWPVCNKNKDEQFLKTGTGPGSQNEFLNNLKLVESGKCNFTIKNHVYDNGIFVENILKEISVVTNSYLSYSRCRLCNIPNGTFEYILYEDNLKGDIKETRWPEGLIHYYEKHNVEPDNMFKEYINNIAEDYRANKND